MHKFFSIEKNDTLPRKQKNLKTEEIFFTLIGTCGSFYTCICTYFGDASNFVFIF